MAEPTSEFLDVDGVRTHLLSGGEGVPLLYLHGIAPCGEWLPLHDSLAQRFAVHAPDHPGFGRSGRPEWLSGMDDLVLHYDELLRRIGLERPHLVGFSLGGWLAAELAVFYPGRFRSLTLFNSAGLHLEGELIPDLPALSREAVGETVFYRPEVATAYFARLLDPERRMQQYRAMTTAALLAWNPWFDPKLERRLGRIDVPTLCLWSEHDRLISPAYGERFRDSIPGAIMEILPDCGHMAPLEVPALVADRITRFCAATPER